MTAAIAILGAGNMGGSLLSGLIATQYPKEKLWLADPEQDKLNLFKNEFQINITTDNNSAVQAADIILFAVKPQIFSQVAKSLATLIQQKKTLIISVAAGIPVKSIQHWLGGNYPLYDQCLTPRHSYAQGQQPCMQMNLYPKNNTI